MDRAVIPVLAGQAVPLASRAQPEDDAVENASEMHPAIVIAFPGIDLGQDALNERPGLV
jgi:hypothetical protein